MKDVVRLGDSTCHRGVLLEAFYLIQEVEEVENLELQLPDESFSFNEIGCHYANLLLELIKKAK